MRLLASQIHQRASAQLSDRWYSVRATRHSHVRPVARRARLAAAGNDDVAALGNAHELARGAPPALRAADSARACELEDGAGAARSADDGVFERVRDARRARDGDDVRRELAGQRVGEACGTERRGRKRAQCEHVVGLEEREVGLRLRDA